MENSYKISDIIKKIEDENSLDLSESERGKLRKKIISIFKKTPSTRENEDGGYRNLFEASIRPTGERKDHFFSPDEVKSLLGLSELQDYITENFILDVQKSEELARDKASAEKQNRDAIRAAQEMLDEKGIEDYDGIVTSSQELRLKKLEIMIEALFLRHFTPIDEELLRNDMTINSMVAGTSDHTAKTVRACNRLKNHAYYEPLEPERKD